MICEGCLNVSVPFMARRKQRPDFAVPPPERGRHDELIIMSPDPKNPGVRRVQIKKPNRLRKYRALGSITEPMAQAGEELASLWERAGLIQRTTANWDGVGGGYTDLSQIQIDARKAITKALSGDRRRYSTLLVNVCCFDEGVNDTRTLRKGLLRLAVHFGLIRRLDF